MTKLVEFVAEICEDSSKLADFKSDPKLALARAGFTNAEIALILCDDPNLIRSAMQPAGIVDDILGRGSAAFVFVGVGVVVATSTQTITNTVTNTVISSIAAPSSGDN